MVVFWPSFRDVPFNNHWISITMLCSHHNSSQFHQTTPPWLRDVSRLWVALGRVLRRAVPGEPRRDKATDASVMLLEGRNAAGGMRDWGGLGSGLIDQQLGRNDSKKKNTQISK